MKQSLRPDLDKVKFSYQACPLPVYVGDHFIKPQDVQGVLQGALVEVSFELQHFCIKKKNEDSFNASVQQVVILQPGEACPTNAFKRCNVFDGPVRPSLPPPCRVKSREGGVQDGPSSEIMADVVHDDVPVAASPSNADVFLSTCNSDGDSVVDTNFIHSFGTELVMFSLIFLLNTGSFSSSTV